MPRDPDDGEYEEIAVLGHDDVWHHVNRHGETMCRMGRKSPVRYEPVDVTCMLCIAMAADGHRPYVRSWDGLT